MRLNRIDEPEVLTRVPIKTRYLQEEQQQARADLLRDALLLAAGLGFIGFLWMLVG